MTDVVQAHLVCGGVFHDFDFARLELLKLLAERAHVRTTVAQDYSDLTSLRGSEVLVTYTCNVTPTVEQVAALRAFLDRGGRWFALHATNAVTEWLSGPNEQPRVATPDLPAPFIDMLGSQFKAHPPLGERFLVRPSKPYHPLAEGIAPFEADDELYLSTYRDGNIPILETRWTGDVPYFDEGAWPEDRAHLVMYLRPASRGGVLYLTLGHCRGHYDFRPVFPFYPKVERCSWDLPVFYELLRRGLTWAIEKTDP